jgi:DNA-binding MarR family transcriptional regulator
VIRRHRARHDDVAETARRVNDRSRAPAGDGISREENARGAGIDHPLHHHRKRDVAVSDAALTTVRDRALVPERCPAAAHGVQQCVLSFDPEIGVLLAREGGARKIFGRGRGTHRDGPSSELPVCRADGVVHVVENADRAKTVAGRLRVARIHFGHARRPQVRRRRQDEAIRYRHSGRDELAEVGTFPARDRAVRGAHIREGKDQSLGCSYYFGHRTFREPNYMPARDLETARALLAATMLGARLAESAARGRGTVSPERARVLFRLADAPLRSGELAQRCLLTPATMTELVEGLAGDGFVRRQEDPSDRRVVVVALTAAGRREVERYQNIFAEALGEAIAELEPAARQRLKLAMEDLRRGLERVSRRKEPAGVR